MPVDYGPVPVSRLKEESAAIFDALSARRRVLVSRHGKVIAAINPASPSEHQEQLAAFAVETAPAPSELTATDFGQGSPSRFIRRAENGEPSLVTRSNKVFGVLTRPDEGPQPGDAREEERALAEFERRHPDASPAEFARVVEALTATGPPVDAVPVGGFVLDDAELGASMLSDALVVKAMALEQDQRFDDAKDAFVSVIHQFGDHPDARTRRRVAGARVELAKIYLREGRSADALRLTEEAIGELGGTAAPRDRAH